MIKTLEWSSSTQYDTGTISSFDLDEHGHCIDVHVGGTKLYYRVGKINNDHKSIDFGKSTRYAGGTVTGIGLSKGGNFVEVHSSQDRLYSRVGKINFKRRAIEWRHGRQYDKYGSGSYCDVAVDKQDSCLEVHVDNSGLYYRVGKVNYTARTIAWVMESTLFSKGQYKNCSVALNEQGHCILTFSDKRNRLFYSVGKINNDSVKWGENNAYDEGNLTSIAIDEEGHCIETHVQNNRLYYCQGKLNNNNKSVNWSESIQYSENKKENYIFTNVALDSQGNCFQTHVIKGSPNNLYYRSTKIQATTNTLWQIGKEMSKSEVEHKRGVWTKLHNYTVGMDDNPIETPNLPYLISVPDVQNNIFSAESVKIYFTIDRDYEPDALMLFYGYFGEEENRIFLDGKLLFKDFGISSEIIRHNRIPFPIISAGEHILNITVVGKRKGYHIINYLNLKDFSQEPELSSNIGLYDVIMKCK